MRYFSPHVLDGSITTAKLATGAVNWQKMFMGVASQSGAIAIQSVVTIALNGRSFSVGIEANISVSPTVDVQVVATRNTTPDPDPLAPTFDLRNESASGATAYAVGWIYFP